MADADIHTNMTHAYIIIWTEQEAVATFGLPIQKRSRSVFRLSVMIQA